MCAMSIVLYIPTFYLVDCIGRVYTAIGGLLLLTLLCTACAINEFTAKVSFLTTILACTARGVADATWTVAYLLTAETYPTFRRTTAVGLGCVFARFGCILSVVQWIDAFVCDNRGPHPSSSRWIIDPMSSKSCVSSPVRPFG